MQNKWVEALLTNVRVHRLFPDLVLDLMLDPLVDQIPDLVLRIISGAKHF